MKPSQSMHKAALTAAAVSLALLVAVPSHAVLPIVAGLGKQLLQNLLMDGVKSQLMGSLANMGCKGAAVASLLSPGGVKAALLPAAMPTLPAMPVMPSGALPGAAANPMAGLMPGMPAMPVGTDSAQMTALMQQMMAGRMPGGGAISPDQMAQLQSSMPMLQQAMAQPLSRTETLAVFDELTELGVMTPAMRTEVRDCVMLAPPAATSALGASGAMLKTMVLPQLRMAREQMANLTPDERTHLANELAQAMKDISPEDRKAFEQGFGQGFFPPDVVEAVKTKLR